MRTAVAFLVFNRPELTRRVLAAIREARPPRLLVVADGPREGHPTDAARCVEVRAVIEAGVDWPCSVEKNYAEKNLGCGRRVTSGLDWVFERAEAAIVLEDDCLPDPTFFRFCEELLERYRDDKRVAQVGGTNHQYRDFRREGSYFFSRYNHIWGWASWRRAWVMNDHVMRDWAGFASGGGCERLFPPGRVARFWRRQWSSVAAGKIDTWDLQWSFACLRRGALTALPTTSLVSNIGFGADATHTTDRQSHELKIGSARFPLVHPGRVEPDAEADAHMERWMFSIPTLAQRFRAGLSRAYAKLAR